MLKLAKRYRGKVEWNVGALFSHDQFIWDLYDNTKIMEQLYPVDYVFGGIPCKFHGGRIPVKDASLKDAKKTIDGFNKRGIGVRLTFSNYFIDEETIKSEERGLALLRYLNRPGKNNGVIVSNDLFARYIKENFKYLEVLASQVKPSIEVGMGPDTPEYYNKLFDLYDVVVVNPAKVDDLEFLERLDHHDRVEFIVNHRCIPNCPTAGKHYIAQMKATNEAVESGNPVIYSEEIVDILNHCTEIKKKIPESANQFSDAQINRLIDMGFNKFKIEGRDKGPKTILGDLRKYVFDKELIDRIVGWQS